MGPSLTLVLSAGERDVFMEAGSERCCVAGFEDRKRKPQVKECRWSLRAGKDKETILLQGLQKEKKFCGYLDFSPVETMLDL